MLIFLGGLYTSRQIVMLITFAVRLTMDNPVRYFLPDVQRFIQTDYCYYQYEVIKLVQINTSLFINIQTIDYVIYYKYIIHILHSISILFEQVNCNMYCFIFQHVLCNVTQHNLFTQWSLLLKHTCRQLGYTVSFRYIVQRRLKNIPVCVKSNYLLKSDYN